MNPTKERKSSQLRVRLTAAERAALERIVQESDKGETVSDVIRQILAAFLKLEGNQAPLFLSGHAHNQVQKLARTLDKEERRVVEECVQGIWDLIEKPDLKVPLIVIEYQVRKDYQSRNDTGAKGK